VYQSRAEEIAKTEWRESSRKKAQGTWKMLAEATENEARRIVCIRRCALHVVGVVEVEEDVYRKKEVCGSEGFRKACHVKRAHRNLAAIVQEEEEGQDGQAH
jgi:hypothetical protein